MQGREGMDRTFLDAASVGRCRRPAPPGRVGGCRPSRATARGRRCPAPARGAAWDRRLRSATTSIPGPNSPVSSSVSVCSPVVIPAQRAPFTARDAHSANTTTRTCGNAPAPVPPARAPERLCVLRSVGRIHRQPVERHQPQTHDVRPPVPLARERPPRRPPAGRPSPSSPTVRGPWRSSPPTAASPPQGGPAGPAAPGPAAHRPLPPRPPRPPGRAGTPAWRRSRCRWCPCHGR